MFDWINHHLLNLCVMSNSVLRAVLPPTQSIRYSKS
ncbi:hypothetical protein predicted by Glimmer/Critica [Salmonella enterica subsp. enterica serovar Weltevreden str. 2007-60-3289-1]|uniref:Uncharacterized protein n=1 Tax=Salmonella paratyphi B (strain ATCC BAA-1250 / SPB7) TaxID=1016998 RepID=A0A6C6YZD0_SALPB|nr:hypothetical protein SPAB_01250 [Salmonella enterica subsp. enterica serovar Paratyphi B str. SPB7]CBY95250.1 hypothetical protein predicted by Glimmer/Critica [Salmonella enterica subsp. enterica serovar Weltevreden str. 2007-60-3289-1]